jgi:hypothetical protein
MSRARRHHHHHNRPCRTVEDLAFRLAKLMKQFPRRELVIGADRNRLLVRVNSGATIQQFSAENDNLGRGTASRWFTINIADPWRKERREDGE